MSQVLLHDFTAFKRLCEQVATAQPRHLTKARPVWIFGAGRFGRDVCSVLKHNGFEVHGFIESKPLAKTLDGLPVLAWPDVAAEHIRAQLVIGIFNRSMPLDGLEQLAKSAGFTDIFLPWDTYTQFAHDLGWRYWLSAPDVIVNSLPAIEQAYNLLADAPSQRCFLEILAFRMGQKIDYAGFTHPDNQYFNALTLAGFANKTLCFVDGGAYNGDTFVELTTKATVSNAFLFEPDPENFKALVTAARKSGAPAVCLPLALSQGYSILSFSAGNGEAGSISTDGTAHIAAVALDDMLIREHIDFIKLDVEGAEILALRGAEKVIKESRPILAISLYHRPDDIWQIINQLSETCINYNMHIRQHYFNTFDSVLYAIPK